MSRKNLYTLLGILFLLANAFAFWLGRYHTIYGVGIYMLPSIWIYALAPALIFLAVKFKKRKNFFLVYLASANILFLVYFTLFGIDRYKPTVKIIAPEDYEGGVYLFHTDEEIDEVIIDKNGIGYLERKNVIYEFYVGDEKVEIKNSSFNIPRVWNDDSTFYNAVRVECYDLSNPNQENNARDGCMNWEEYLELIDIGWVDPNRVKDCSRALEEAEMLQRKINKEFRVFWPTNLQTGEFGEMKGKPIHEKIYSYLTFKYDTLGSKTALACGFKQTF